MTAPAANLPALTPSAALALDKHPAAVYLASLAAGPGRVSMRSTLRQVAAMLGCTLGSCPWHELRFAHVAALRSQLADRYAPATANKYLSAIRRTCRQAWLLGLMPGEDYHRIAAVENVKGSRLPAGRALDGGEIGALFAACADGTAAGARDAAAFALMFGCGLRRSEAAAVRFEDFDAATGALRIIGKGNRERTVYATNGGRAAVDAWIAIRGEAPGPLLAPVSKSGTIAAGAGMTPHALMKRLQRRSRGAAIAACTPHDLRRSFVSSVRWNPERISRWSRHSPATHRPSPPRGMTAAPKPPSSPPRSSFTSRTSAPASERPRTGHAPPPLRERPHDRV